MALFGKKNVCPNCGQPQEKNWDKCPFCAQMGGMPGGGGGGMPAQPPQQQYAAQPPSTAQKTVAFMVGAGGQTNQQLLGWVIPLKGPHRGELHTLKPQATVIGKDPASDVVFNDPFMSSKHATIRAQNGIYMLEDHSTNGTWVNDKKIKTHELVDNDFIKFGQTMVKFKSL